MKFPELSQAELIQAEPSRAEKVPSQVEPSWNQVDNMYVIKKHFFFQFSFILIYVK